MTKIEWLRHWEEKGQHDQFNCSECAARRKTKRANDRARQTRQVYADLGMMRVKGALGGVYYE